MPCSFHSCPLRKKSHERKTGSHRQSCDHYKDVTTADSTQRLVKFPGYLHLRILLKRNMKQNVGVVQKYFESTAHNRRGPCRSNFGLTPPQPYCTASWIAFSFKKKKEETQKTPKGINVILALVIFAESPSSQDVIGVKELVRFAYAFCNILRTVTYYKGRFLLFKIILPFWKSRGRSHFCGRQN